jgi:hypothetical protein
MGTHGLHGDIPGGLGTHPCHSLVRLQRCVTENAKQDLFGAVKIIAKPLNSSGYLNCNRELEAIAKFSNERVS